MKCQWHQFLEMTWLIEYCWTSSGKYFMHIQDESILMNGDEWTLLCTILTRWAGLFTSQLMKATVCRKTCHFLSTHKIYSYSGSTCLMNASCLAHSANANFNVFDLTRQGMTPKTFRIRGEHAYHYTRLCESGSLLTDLWVHRLNLG